MTTRGSADSVQARQAAFEKEVNEKIKQLRSPKVKPEAREAAAYWLGEAGDPTAIPALRDAYRSDPVKEVKDAAVYALGMFRALGDALAGGDAEKEHAMQLLERIVLEGKMGKRRQSKGLVRLLVMLTVSLILLGALNLILPPMLRGGGTSVAATNTPAVSGVAAVVRDMRIMHEQLTADANVVSAAYLAALQSLPPDCEAPLTNPPVFTLTAETSTEYPQLIGVADGLNAARDQLQTAQLPFVENCAALNPESLSEPFTIITTLINQTLPELAQTLDTVAAAVIPPTPTPEISATPSETPTLSPTETPAGPTPTPTEAPDLRIHISALTQIIDTVTRRDGNGAYTQLALYWNDVATTGNTGGCQALPPPIPQEYNLPPEVGAASPELRGATESVRLALQLLRDGWMVFQRACSDGTLLTQQPAAGEAVRLAGDQFELARAVLQQLIDQGS